MREDDFAWYKENLKNLYEKYGDSYIAIKNKSVLGCYQSAREALHETEKTERPGSFIVQKCGANEDAYTVRITSIFTPITT